MSLTDSEAGGGVRHGNEFVQESIEHSSGHSALQTAVASSSGNAGNSWRVEMNIYGED